MGDNNADNSNLNEVKKLEKADIDKTATVMVLTPQILCGKNNILFGRFIQNLNIVFYLIVNLIYDNCSLFYFYMIC